MKLTPFLTATALAAAFASACTTAPEDTGNVSLALTGQSSSGITYRLRDAQIDLAGAGAVTSFSTETDPTRTALTAHVASGPYTLELRSGWRLERIAADGTAANVAATLLSANPQPLEVIGGGTTFASLRFRAGGEDVPMGEGDVVVVIDVDDVDAGLPQVDAAPPQVDAAPPQVDAAPIPDASPTAPPSLTITSGPTGATSQNNVVFGFVYANGDAVCRYDGAPFVPCPSGFFGSGPLADGAHTFEVRVDNFFGVVQDGRSFIVDTVAPLVTITSAPTGTVPSPVTIGFATGGATTTTCQVDSGAAVSCVSPFTTPPLAAGTHVIRINAFDAAGNLGIAQVTVSTL